MKSLVSSTQVNKSAKKKSRQSSRQTDFLPIFRKGYYKKQKENICKKKKKLSKSRQKKKVPTYSPVYLWRPRNIVSFAQYFLAPAARQEFAC